MISPSLSSPTPEGASLQPASPRRRALSYLRHLSSQNRTSDQPRGSLHAPFPRSVGSTEGVSRAGQPPASSNQPPPPPPPPPPEPRTRSRTADALQAISSPNAGQVNATGGTADSASQPAASSLVLVDSARADTTAGEATNSDDQASDNMARQRAASARKPVPSAAARSATTSPPAVDGGTRAAAAAAAAAASSTEPAPGIAASGEADKEEGEKQGQLPTIRFFPHHEVRSNGRQSLNFTPISRTLPTEHSIIRVGRYSERDGIPTANPTSPSDAPVGFKSKVVSRKHCEFAFLSGQWHIKDVASSSGTFLNHIRLSQPNTESRQFPIKDGDIVQLGIDFRGGEEMIFRCVKIRIECNRAWQKKPNTFNKSRHVQLQMLGKDPTAGRGSTTNNNECSICLGSVLPCQSLFVAPCAHVWHYKCIRPLLEGKNSTYPQFQCPNCRAYTDLTADVDIAESDMDEWMGNTDNAAPAERSAGGDPATPAADLQPSSTNESTAMITPPTHSEESAEEATTQLPWTTTPAGLLARRQAASAGSSPNSQPLNALNISSDPGAELSNTSGAVRRSEHPPTWVPTHAPQRSDTGDLREGPTTPTNNAGPFVFDGDAGRAEATANGVPS